MNSNILDFLKTQRACVLAVEMLDGSPHGATIHFAHKENPFIFYFETNRQYRKVQPLFGKHNTRATVVIGTSQDTTKTFQMDGVLRLVEDSEVGDYNKVYLGKFPEKLEKSQKPDFVRMIFSPTWWRYTNWDKNGKIILTSENT